MASTFVVMIAFWHNELTRAEASRHIATARILLEYPRWRWNTKLDSAIQLLLDFARLAGLSLDDEMRMLLPDAEQSFPNPLCKESSLDLSIQAGMMSPASSEQPAQSDGSLIGQTSLPLSQPWMAPAFISSTVNNFAFNYCETQPFFGVWDMSSYPMNIETFTDVS